MEKAPNKRYGLKRPNLLFVLSTIVPIKGSARASIILTTKNIVPAAAADKPKTSV